MLMLPFGCREIEGTAWALNDVCIRIPAGSRKLRSIMTREMASFLQANDVAYCNCFVTANVTFCSLERGEGPEGKEETWSMFFGSDYSPGAMPVALHVFPHMTKISSAQDLAHIPQRIDKSDVLSQFDEVYQRKSNVFARSVVSVIVIFTAVSRHDGNR